MHCPGVATGSEWIAVRGVGDHVTVGRQTVAWVVRGDHGETDCRLGGTGSRQPPEPQGNGLPYELPGK